MIFLRFIAFPFFIIWPNFIPFIFNQMKTQETSYELSVLSNHQKSVFFWVRKPFEWLVFNPFR